jgi:hypothetical protein
MADDYAINLVSEDEGAAEAAVISKAAATADGLVRNCNCMPSSKSGLSTASVYAQVQL